MRKYICIEKYAAASSGLLTCLGRRVEKEKIMSELSASCCSRCMAGWFVGCWRNMSYEPWVKGVSESSKVVEAFQKQWLGSRATRTRYVIVGNLRFPYECECDFNKNIFLTLAHYKQLDISSNDCCLGARTDFVVLQLCYYYCKYLLF